MFRKAIFSLVLCGTSFLSAEENLPQVINYGDFPQILQGYYSSFDYNLWKMGAYAFNYAPEITPFFGYLKKAYKIDTVVETGTLWGSTTVVFAQLFDHVHTIEIDQNNFNVSSNTLKAYSNVASHLGNSPIVLNEILPHLKHKRVLFYLDAHWHSYWPLLDELEEISQTHKDQCIIVIDDFKIPNRSDIPYDHYKGHACSLEYTKSGLEKIFSSYDVHFLIPRSIHSRGKLVAIPKQWANPSFESKEF